jgi:hypothetical protein
VVWCALLVAIASATQDIALDAFRIESADTRLQGVLAATYQTGYRLAMIWAGAGVLWIAARAEVPVAVVQGAQQVAGAAYQNGGWQVAYFVMAASMGVGMLTVLFSREPARAELPPARNVAEWLQGALVEPFADFLRRLPLARGADTGADRHLPHQRRGDGHHGQSLLCGHGLHQGRGGGGDQGLRRHHDPGSGRFWAAH